MCPLHAPVFTDVLQEGFINFQQPNQLSHLAHGQHIKATDKCQTSCWAPCRPQICSQHCAQANAASCL